MTPEQAYLTALLEQIAFNTQKGPLEFEPYLERIRSRASQIRETTEVHGGRTSAKASRKANADRNVRTEVEPLRVKVLETQDDAKV